MTRSFVVPDPIVNILRLRLLPYSLFFFFLFSRTGHQWWWVPIVAPFLGAIAGVTVYQLMIGCHDEPSPPACEQETVKLSNVKHKERV